MNSLPAPDNQHPSAATCPKPFSEAEEQALEAFGFWLDGELEKLVARWMHLAAPNATRPQRITRK